MDAQIENLMQSIRVSSLDGFFWAVSFSIFIVCAGVLFYYFYKRDNLRALQISIGFGTLFIFIEVLKNLFLRLRPDLSANDSFPSRHTAFAFFVAAFLPVEKKWKILLWTWAFLVAFSRLWLNVHWFSDVIAGAGIGIVLAFLIKNKNLEKKLEKIKII